MGPAHANGSISSPETPSSTEPDASYKLCFKQGFIRGFQRLHHRVTLPSQSYYSLASARLCSLSKGGNESEYHCSIGIRQAGAAGATPRNAQKPNVGTKSEQYLNARKLHLSARDKRTGAGSAGKRKAGG